jgi:hypothetical protein
MVSFPEPVHETVHDIINEVVTQFPNDIPGAIKAAEQRLRALPEFDDLVATLITSAVQDLIYQRRGAVNVRLRCAAGEFDTKPRTRLQDSPDTLIVWDNVYGYYIAGRTLGEVRGEDLEAIEEGERNVSKGHEFNAELCRWLRQQGVAGEQRVKDVVSEKKLRTAFRRIRKAVFGVKKPEMAEAGH